MAVSLTLFKAHVNVDYDTDDTLLQHYLDAAEEAVIKATNRTSDELMFSGALPAALQQAILMLAGHWYNQRESVSGVQMHEVPDSLQSLIKPFRKLAQ